MPELTAIGGPAVPVPDDTVRVAPSSALMGDLKALLGPGCLG